MLIDLTGKTYGKLTVLKYNGHNFHRAIMWLCQCSCGNIKSVIGSELKRGRVRSCGCLFRYNNLTHGRSYTYEYQCWADMLQRCNNKNSNNYKYYGARGITVCERWRKFENFYADMGERPNDNYSLDRINNDGNYEPNNCRWTTTDIQAQNKRVYLLKEAVG